MGLEELGKTKGAGEGRDLMGNWGRGGRASVAVAGGRERGETRGVGKEERLGERRGKEEGCSGVAKGLPSLGA